MKRTLNDLRPLTPADAPATDADLAADADTITSIVAAIRDAVIARDGDSNDTEIEALWDCVEQMAAALGIPVPDYVEQD